MKKNKNKSLFWVNQRFFLLFVLIFVFLLSSALVVYSSYSRIGLISSDYLKGSTAQAQAMDPELLKQMEAVYKKLSAWDNHIRQNIASIAPEGSQGLGVDGVSFIGPDRALIFYHDQEKRLISEVVMAMDDNGQPKVAKNFLKVSNGNDYSKGVYGADPN